MYYKMYTFIERDEKIIYSIITYVTSCLQAKLTA